MTQTVITIPMVPASEYDTREYGITFRSEFVYDTAGSGFHNPHFPHRFNVWDNTVRPNVGPKYGPDAPGPMNHGRIGEGAYVSPNRKGTDDVNSFVLSSESMAITNSGTNTGTVASGQVWSPYEEDLLRIGSVVVLRYPDGTESVPLTLVRRFCDEPALVPVTDSEDVKA